MKNIVEVFMQIQETSSRTGKEAILKANEDNKEFRAILEFMYNPYVLTGIKFKKLVKFAQYVATENEDIPRFDSVFDAITYLSANNSGRDVDVKAIANFINTYDTDISSPVHDFLQEMFTKNFKCGITASTINKVYGKRTIPEFDVLLAKSYKDHGHKLKGKFYVTLKLDGIRCVAIKKGSTVQFYTRQGQPIDDLVEIQEELLNLPFDNFVFDGELLLKPNGMNSADLFRATQKVVRKDGVKKGLDFHVFDGLPVDEFMAGKSRFGYETRRNMISSGCFNGQHEHIKHLPVMYSGDNKDQILDLLDKVIAEGHEGLMINTANGYYETKRSDVLLKVKEMYTVDLKVVGLEEGTGKYKGTLGALIVDYKGYEVKVGSGFTDGERNIIWNTMQESIVGRVIEVQYFEESKNQDGGISLRFPVYIQLREEGKEVSYH